MSYVAGNNGEVSFSLSSWEKKYKKKCTIHHRDEMKRDKQTVGCLRMVVRIKQVLLV